MDFNGSPGGAGWGGRGRRSSQPAPRFKLSQASARSGNNAEITLSRVWLVERKKGIPAADFSTRGGGGGGSGRFTLGEE